VISLDRTLSFSEAQWDSHFWLSSSPASKASAPEFAHSAPKPTWCRQVAQPLLAGLFEVQQGQKMLSPARHRYRFPAHSMKNAHPEGSIANRRIPRHDGTPSHHPVLGAPVALWQIVVFVFINLRIAFSATHLFSQTSALPPVISKSISKNHS
jgi:hypothetical protein